MSQPQKIIIIVILLLVVSLGVWWYISQRSQSPPSGALQQVVNMQIISPAFSDGQPIPSKYTCDGTNVSPPLKFSDMAEGARSLVLIVDDPDAPAGTWVHWTLWNISPQTTEIAENSVPDGAIEGITDFGRPGYGGPCPPSGTHRYFFKLYALDITLNLKLSVRAADIEKTMEGHILAKAELVGLYQRK